MPVIMLQLRGLLSSCECAFARPNTATAYRIQTFAPWPQQNWMQWVGAFVVKLKEPDNSATLPPPLPSLSPREMRNRFFASAN